jgi:hypothetical protein
MPDNSIQIAAINGNNTVVFDDSGKVLWETSSIGDRSGIWSASFATGDLTGNGDPNWAFLDNSGALVIATSNGQKLSQVPASGNISTFAIASLPGRPGLLLVLNGGTVTAYTFHP